METLKQLVVYQDVNGLLVSLAKAWKAAMT